MLYAEGVCQHAGLLDHQGKPSVPYLFRSLVGLFWVGKRGIEFHGESLKTGAPGRCAELGVAVAATRIAELLSDISRPVRG